VRPSALLAGVVALSLALAGCADAAPEEQAASETTEGASPAEAESDTSWLVDGCAPGGEVAESLEVSTTLGAAPEVTFEPGLQVEHTQRTVVVEGDGELVKELDRVMVAYSYFNGVSGEKIGHIGYDGQAPDMIPADPSYPYLKGVIYSLLCSTVGSRIAAVIPSVEAFGAEGAPEYGLQPGDSVVFVADIVGIQPPPEPPLTKLEGVMEPSPGGYPQVEFDEAGMPTVTFPDGDVPTDYGVTSLIKGQGSEVFDGATVIVHYHGVNWNTGEVFDSSFERGEPASFSTAGVIPGFRDGLVGQTIGSRVLIIIPPALGYGPSGGSGDGRIGPDDTIFFVVDILGIQ
jgi:peptidylprolyl isomerase